MSEPRGVKIGAEPSEAEAPGIASRAVDVDGTRWALVEYEPDVLREEFCDVGHSGYVLRGEVTYEFADGGEPLRVQAGDGLVLPGAREHRGRSGPEGVTLFLIDAEVG